MHRNIDSNYPAAAETKESISIGRKDSTAA
jgi:hypothetical protein